MPARDRKFVNPLTQSSTSPSPLSSTEASPLPPPLPATLPSTDTSTLSSTETPTYPATSPATLPATYTSTSTPPARRKRGDKAFERTHERVTLWLDKGLKAQFEALADAEGAAKSTLLDEAITDLLQKYQA